MEWLKPSSAPSSVIMSASIRARMQTPSCTSYRLGSLTTTRFTRTRHSDIVHPVSSSQLTETRDCVRSFGGYNSSLREQRVVQWEIQSLAVTGQIEPVVALERLDLRHPGDQVLDICGRTGFLVIVVERAHRHLPGVVGHAKRLDVPRLHPGPALVLERGDARLVEIDHQEPRVLDRLVPRHLPKLVA